MKKYYKRQNDSKIVLYAIVLAIVFGIGAIVVQDVQIPTEHVTKEIQVKINN